MPVSAYFHLKQFYVYIIGEKHQIYLKLKRGGYGKNRSECPVISILWLNKELMTLGVTWKGPGGSRISVF